MKGRLVGVLIVASTLACGTGPGDSDSPDSGDGSSSDIVEDGSVSDSDADSADVAGSDTNVDAHDGDLTPDVLADLGLDPDGDEDAPWNVDSGADADPDSETGTNVCPEAVLRCRRALRDEPYASEICVIPGTLVRCSLEQSRDDGRVLAGEVEFREVPPDTDPPPVSWIGPLTFEFVPVFAGRYEISGVAIDDEELRSCVASEAAVAVTACD